MDALIHKYLDDCATQDDLAELSRSLADNVCLSDAFVRLTRLESLLAEQLLEQHATGALVQSEARPSRPITIARGRKQRVALAAAVLLIAAGTIWSIASRSPSIRQGVVSGQVLVDGVATKWIPNGARMEVAGGVPAVVRLASGSQAIFAPASAAVFRDGEAARQVLELDEGEGQFQLAKNDRSLQIDTPAGVVVARGSDSQPPTEFSLKLVPKSIEGVEPMRGRMLLLLSVMVMAGQVEVRSDEQAVTLNAGESQTFTTEKKPTATGTIEAVSDDGRLVMLSGRPPKPGAPPSRVEVRITDKTELVYFGVPQGGDKPTVGYPVTAWLDKQAKEQAVRIEFGVKQPDFEGRIVDVSKDEQQVTLEVQRKGSAATQHVVKLGERTSLNYTGVEERERRLRVGLRGEVWLMKNDAETAAAIRFSFKNKNKVTGKPEETVKPVKPASEKPVKPTSEKSAKPASVVKPKSATKTGIKPSPEPLVHRVSSRSPVPIAAAIDREISAALQSAAIPASGPADDGEFLRRATLDITGHIPNYALTMAFLGNTEPDKRQALVEQLVASPEYGRHFGAIWRSLILPREPANAKPRIDRFGPWLAEQFNANRGWDQIVYDLLTAEGDMTRDPQAGFFLGNAENLEPKANMLTASVGRLFLGVQLACAECHNHPFAEWKQTDFWRLAAFFSRVHRRGKADFNLIETLDADADPSLAARPAIRIPDSAGKAAGELVPAGFLHSPSVQLPSDGPLRPSLGRWVTAADNRLFARAATNRLWAHFFGRGLVHPIDALHADNPPSHPAVLELLADEFVASGFDLQHMTRCICTTETYQRTSRPLRENKDDTRWLSHMAIKVLTADQLYDSLLMALNANPRQPAATPGMKQPQSTQVQLEPRERFVVFFTPIDSVEASQFSQGIPQLLRLMNSEPFNQGAPFIAAAASSGAAPEQIVETIYLAVLSRRPKAEESQLMATYLADAADAKQAYKSVFWTLLNSSEFMLNR